MNLKDNTSANIYEQAFESWLAERRIGFVPIDQHRKIIYQDHPLKSFDFLIWPDRLTPVIAEVKGKKFTGQTLVGLKGLQCWVGTEDIQGLLGWEKAIRHEIQKVSQQPYKPPGPGPAGHPDLTDHSGAVFVFAYRLEQIDVEDDGIEVYEFLGQRFVFFVVRLDDYRRDMVTRSPAWKTLTLPVSAFRTAAIPAEKFWLC